MTTIIKSQIYGFPINADEVDITHAKVIKDGTIRDLIDVIDDPQTDALAGLTPAADTLPYFTSQTTAETTSLTSFARTILDDANAAAARSTIGADESNNINFLQAGTGATTRTVRDKLRDIINVKDFGAVGDGVTDDLTAIQTAYTAAIAANKALAFPPGTYAISGTWTISHSSVRIIALGKVIIKHTGTGNGVAIDGGSGSGQNIFNIEFGWGSGIHIHGNTNTTAALYVRGAHHLKVNVNVRDCTYGVDIVFTVLSQFIISGSFNEAAYSKQPTSILRTDRRVATENPSVNTFWVIAEGTSSYGIDLAYCTLGMFYGSSEGNASGGLRLRSTSYRNTFVCMDNEDNGTSADWFIEGDDNVFINCIGAISTTSLVVDGDRNRFIDGYFATTEVNSGAAYTQFHGVELVTLTDNSTTTLKRLCHDGASLLSEKDPVPPPQLISGISGATTIAAGATGYFTQGYTDAVYYNAAAAIPFDCRVTAVRIFTPGAPGVGQTYTFYLRVDDVDTALTGTISGNAANSVTFTGSVSITAGQRWAIKAVCSAGAAALTNVSFGIKYDAPTYS